MTLTFDLLNQQINEFPGLMVENFYVKFGYPIAVSIFLDIVWKSRQAVLFVLISRICFYCLQIWNQFNANVHR